MEFNKHPLKSSISVESALPKIKHYCAYQERSHYEVKEKLYKLGLYKTGVETLLAQLIEEDYLNEERFARRFASGKFSLKKWGRIKIKHELKLKRVSEYNIKIGLKEIREEDYTLTLQKLTDDKWDNLKGEKSITRQAKTMAFLLQKGYEAPFVQQAIKNIAGK